MRSFSLHAILTLVIAGAACATVSVPQGKGFASLDAPFEDSFVVSGTVRQSYADQELTGAQARMVFGMLFPAGSYQLDTTAQVVIASPQGSVVTSDSAGLQHTYRMSVAALGVTYLTEHSRHYDAQGRLAFELGSTTTTSSVPVVPSGRTVDTTSWTWTNPGCADDKQGDTIRLWSVDAQGRCSVADVRVLAPTGSGSVSTGFVDKFLWEGANLSKAYRLQGSDTLLRDVFAVDGQGNVTEQVSHEKVSGVWILTSRDTFQYSQGKLQSVRMNEYSQGVLASHLVFSNTNSRTGVLEFGRGTGSWMTVRRDGNSVSFTNGSSESVALDLVDSRGRRLDALVVAAGSTVAWNAPRGPVFWRAQASSRNASGIIPRTR